MSRYDDRETFEAWAKTQEFDQPLRWGQVEKAVTRRRAPLWEGDTAWFDAFSVALNVALVVVLGPLLGAPIFAFAAVLAARASDSDTAETWFTVAVVFLLISAASGFAAVISVFSDGGDTTSLTWAALVVGFGIPSFLILRDLAADDYSAERPLHYSVAALALGGIGVVANLLGRPALELPFTVGRFKRMPRIRTDRYKKARAVILTVLHQRGIAHLEPGQVETMNSMDLGTWHTLDADDRPTSRRS